VKLQKGETKLIDGVESNFYKVLVTCESRWRLLVFWVPHIHWRRLRDKVEKIPEDSTANSHRSAQTFTDSGCRHQ